MGLLDTLSLPGRSKDYLHQGPRCIPQFVQTTAGEPASATVYQTVLLQKYTLRIRLQYNVFFSLCQVHKCDYFLHIGLPVHGYAVNV